MDKLVRYGIYVKAFLSGPYSAIVRAMPRTMNTPAQTALHDRLRAIPAGQVSATARAAEIALRQLNRLREGKNLDVRLSTLEKLATALGQAIVIGPGAEMIAAATTERAPADAVLDARTKRRLRRQLEAVAAAAEKAMALIPKDGE